MSDFDAERELARKYPLHTELKARDDERRTVQDFLDWLYEEQKLRICEFQKDYGGQYVPVYQNREQLIGMFLKIDPKELNKEKDAMYAELQASIQKG